jgi:hypothetical protein
VPAKTGAPGHHRVIRTRERNRSTRRRRFHPPSPAGPSGAGHCCCVGRGAPHPRPRPLDQAPFPGCGVPVPGMASPVAARQGVTTWRSAGRGLSCLQDRLPLQRGPDGGDSRHGPPTLSRAGPASGISAERHTTSPQPSPSGPSTICQTLTNRIGGSAPGSRLKYQQLSTARNRLFVFHS